MKITAMKTVPAYNLGISKVGPTTVSPLLAQPKAPRLALPPLAPELSPKRARPKAKKIKLTEGGML